MILISRGMRRDGRYVILRPGRAKGSDMAKKLLKELLIDRARCKGCGICVYFCPKDVLVLDEEDKASVMTPSACIACGMCELYCPDLAIEMIAQDAPPRGAGQTARDKAQDAGGPT